MTSGASRDGRRAPVTDGRREALAEIRELLFGDLPPLIALERLGAIDGLRALAEAALREDRPGAEAALEALLRDTNETRVCLQAWTLARAAGIEPPADTAQVPRGVIVEVGLDGGTDTLAVFADGTARYLNQSGAAIIWEAEDADVGASIGRLIAAAQAVANATGPLDGPRPPAPPTGGGAVWVLTDGGTRGGFGPFGALSTDPLGGPVIAAGIDLMRLLIERDAAARPG